MLILPRGAPVIFSSCEPFRSFGATQRRRRARSRKRPLIHIDRALVHASLSATLFSLSCRRRHRSVIEAWTKRWRLHNPPPAKADTDRKHTSPPTATCIPHNVFAQPRLYDTANNRSWCQADILRMPQLGTHERADISDRTRVNRAVAALFVVRLGIRRQLRKPTAVSLAVVCVRNV